MNAIDYANKISELFTMPKTAARVKRLIDSQASDVESISAVVKTDPSLALHILKVANSAIYRFPRKIESVEKAIQVIGTSAVYDFALIFGISNAFNNDENECIDLDRFWEQSVSCSILARHFATLAGIKNTDRLFMSGLLHNIGELVVLKVSPSTAKDCSVFDAKLSPRQCQLDVLGFTYAEISAALSQQWMLPDPLVSILAMQHHEDSAAETLEIQIIQLAYELSIINTYPEHYKFDAQVPVFLYESLNLNEDDMEEALDNTNYQVEQIIHLFNPDAFKAA